ncbi:MAG: hemerythrin domain-containing protein [Myxococcales bacterium]|nr:hemerythrin domain-containing protein [Myxococcales bacterium]
MPVEFDRMLAALFEEEDQARSMARTLMDEARTSVAAAAAERTRLLAFMQGPLENHMVYEEDFIFPLLKDHGLEAEVAVCGKHHRRLRELRQALGATERPEEIAPIIFETARLMLHHTNFEGDYIYPELSRDQWRALMRQTRELEKERASQVGLAEPPTDE